ncbi:NADH-quinone oxidoreductase subunit C [Streptomyces sp. NPDC101490]|uniref:NADH-quinone oxidoreductase subunit C n=1 Tax=Streptomyces sp. NPDC101490 TaxID=3366143 RepID=UPI0038239AFB
MTAAAYDSLPGAVTELFGGTATAEHAYDLLTVDVPPASWLTALETARDTLGCAYFDWLSAVDEPGTGFRVCAHVVSLGDGRPRRLLVRTTVPHEAAVLPTARGIYAGADWHERETHEMFGVDFTGHPHLVPLLLPENFEGHPLRKDFVLAARVAKAWPGAKEPGESHDGGPKRRQMLPPGVPDPNEWGPLKGQLPPAPARPSRAASGDRPPRRTRTTTDAPTSPPPTSPAAPDTPAVASAPSAASAASAAEARPPRRTRSASDGSASQSAPAPDAPPDATPAAPPATGAPPRRSRSASDGSASQTPPRRSRSASDGSVSQAQPPETGTEPQATPRTRSTDAPWHHASPAFDTPDAAASPEPGPEPAPTPGPEPAPEPGSAPAPTAEDDPAPGPQPRPAGGDPALAGGDSAPAEGDSAPAGGAPAEGDPGDPPALPSDPTHPAGGDPA